MLTTSNNRCARKPANWRRTNSFESKNSFWANMIKCVYIYIIPCIYIYVCIVLYNILLYYITLYIRRPRQTQGGARQGIRQAKTSKFRHTTTRSSNLAAGTAGTIADELLVKIQKLSTVPAASVAVRATAAVLPEAAFLVSCSSSSNQFFAKIQSRREFYCREVFRRLRAAAAVQQLAASQQPPAAFNSS